MQQEISSSVTSNLPRMTQCTGASDIFASKPYSSIFFQTDRSGASQTPLTTSSSDRSATATAAAALAAFSRLMSQHKDLTNRFSFCMSQLQKTFKEAETLRQENTNLRVANRELSQQISILLDAAALQAAASFQETIASPSSFSSGEMKKKEKEADEAVWEEGLENTSESPTSVIEHERSQQKAEAGRVSLPKSISVRSNGYLKMSPGGAALSSGSSSEPKPKPKRGAALKIHSDNAVSDPALHQKVYVRGGSNKEGPIELEVFNQGMFKTELCNKWQETGNCPYGDHCQFAHGILELRPVIRHPRYKTEVCRMVLAGDPCPYGHRCHFRHALTQEEQLMLPLRLE